MPKLKNESATIIVQFGIQWRGADGRWRSQTWDYPAQVAQHRRVLEATGCTEISEHMRDRRIEHSPWKRTDRPASTREER